MFRAPLAVLALLLSVSLAGCLGGSDSEGDADRGGDDADPGPAILPGREVEPVTGDPIPWQPPHDHANHAHHDTDRNIDLLAYPEQQRGGAELDVRGGWGAQCFAGGVKLWNMSAPDAPVVVAILELGRGCPDVKLTEDAAYLVAAGTQLWDLRDKENPVRVAENRETGCHMCSVDRIGDKEYLFSGSNGAGVVISELSRDPPAITPVAEWGFGTSCNPAFGDDPARFVNTRGPDPDCLLIGQFHDMYVYDDPLLNTTVMVPAYWDLGIWFVDVGDPANPTALGSWADYRGESGDIHTTSVDFLEVDGEVRRIAVAATETGPIIGPVSTATPSGVYVFDATDLGNIELKARWVNPGRHPSGAQGGIVGEYSTHNLQFVDGRVYLAHYHAGVWVLDVQAWLDAGGVPGADTNARGDDVPVLGVAVPRVEGAEGQVMVWDVVLHQGFLYASEELFGLFVLHFHGDARFDPSLTSDA